MIDPAEKKKKRGGEENPSPDSLGSRSLGRDIMQTEEGTALEEATKEGVDIALVLEGRNGSKGMGRADAMLA